MANTQASDLKIDTLYVHEAIDQSAEAYKNLLLLALKNRTDLCRLGSAIDKSMKNYSAGKQLRLHESFRGIAYMSALARENDRSLLRILYMGPKEQKALLRSIVQDISVDQVRDFKMLDPVRKAAEFKVMLYSEEPVSGQSSGPGYLMTFRKRAVNSEEGLSYTLEARFIRGDSDFDDPYFLFREQTLAWEEFTGDLATCIEKIISYHDFIISTKENKEGTKLKNDYNNIEQVTNKKKVSIKESSSFENVVWELKRGISASSNDLVVPNDDVLQIGTQKTSHYKNNLYNKNNKGVKQKLDYLVLKGRNNKNRLSFNDIIDAYRDYRFTHDQYSLILSLLRKEKIYVDLSMDQIKRLDDNTERDFDICLYLWGFFDQEISEIRDDIIRINNIEYIAGQGIIVSVYSAFHNVNAIKIFKDAISSNNISVFLETINEEINIVNNKETNSIIDISRMPIDKNCYNIRKQFEYTINDNEVTIVKYNGTDDIVVIPGYLEGLPVTCIDGDLFRGNRDVVIRKVVLPNTVKKLISGFNANIESVELPDGLLFIGKGAFDAIPIRYLYIPASVQTIEEGAFWECGNLFIEVDPGNKHYCSEDGKVFDITKKVLLFYPYHTGKDISFPESIQRIGDGVFSNYIGSNSGEKPRTYIIPQNVKEIGENCFSYQPWEIVLHNKLTSIGSGAFINCLLETNLTELLKNSSELVDNQFEEVIFSEDVDELVIPESIVKLGKSIFSNAFGLKKIIIPKTMKIVNMDFAEFNLNNEIKVVEFKPGIEKLCSFGHKGGRFDSLSIHDLELIIPNSVKEISNIEFWGCIIYCNKGSFIDGYINNINRNRSNELRYL